MNAKILLRIATIPILIKLLGHSAGHSGWDNPEDPRMKEVVSAMKGYTGEFMGASYNMAEYYTGYSLMLVCVYLLIAYILWLVSGFISEQVSLTNKIVYPIAFIFFIFGVLEFLYFFPFAASMSVLAGVLMILSITVAKR